MPEAKLLSVFLCHASEDKEKVKKLHDRLTKDGVDAWLDSEKIKPGENWRMVIEKAVAEAHVVVVFLSGNSTSKEGFVQREIKIALDLADEKPEGTIFIIPARLEECSVPERLKGFHWVDLFMEGGYEKMFDSLKTRAGKLNIPLLKNDQYYSSYHRIFPEVEKLARTYVMLESMVYIKEIAVAGVYTWELWKDMVTRLVSQTPAAVFSLESLLVDPRRLDGFSKIQTDWAAMTKQRIQEIRLLQTFLDKEYGSRARISVRFSDNLPERIGILLNEKNLFYSEVDFVDHDSRARIVAGSSEYSYHSSDTQQGANDIKRFINRFKYYWNNSTSLQE